MSHGPFSTVPPGGESNVSKVNRKKPGNSSTSFQVSRVNSTICFSIFCGFSRGKGGDNHLQELQGVVERPWHAQMDDVAVYDANSPTQTQPLEKNILAIWRVGEV